MPRLKIGDIPTVRLSAARLLKDRLNREIGEAGFVLVTWYKKGFAVKYKLYENQPFPACVQDVTEINGVPVLNGGRIRPEKDTHLRGLDRSDIDRVVWETRLTTILGRAKYCS